MADRLGMETEGDLFRFLEDDLSTAGGLRTGTAGQCSDVLALASEIANQDWPEPDAAQELARAATHARLHQAQTQLLAQLASCAFPNVHGIRMSRILWRALEL